MIRLDVVTGFLGAGKTTFLARYLPWLQKRGIACCLIENEFGRAGMDGQWLELHGARVKEISGGCVCCSLKATLYEYLLHLSDEVERIVLEPSGLFCGDDLMDILLSPEIVGRVQLGLWVGMIDPLTLPLMNAEDLAVLYSEVINAGSIILSKIQLSTPEERDEARRLCASLYGSGDMPALYAAPWDAYSDDEWFEALMKQGCCLRSHPRRRFDHTTMFQSATFTLGGVYSRQKLQKALEAALNGQWGEVLRIKGAVFAQEGGAYSLNCTCGCLELCHRPMAQEAVVNIIGRRLRRKELRHAMEEAANEAGTVG